ncbi:MAG: hypothetical protein ACK4S3_03235, partial [Parvibaculum sp.]
MSDGKLGHVPVQQGSAFLVTHGGGHVGPHLMPRRGAPGGLRYEKSANTGLDAKSCLEQRRSLDLVSTLFWDYRIHERESDENGPTCIDASNAERDVGQFVAVFRKRKLTRRAGRQIKNWNLNPVRLADPDVDVVALFDPIRGEAAGNPHLRDTTGRNNAEGYACHGGLLDRAGPDCIVLAVGL